MISLDNKTPTSTSSSPIALVSETDTESPTLSFSQLLRGAGTSKDDKEVQNGVLVLALGEDAESSKEITLSKTDSLLALLKGEPLLGDKTPVELNPALTKELTPSELKALVKDAKNYLRDKITLSEGFKKSEISSLPKTLKGLVRVAEKFGIDVSKITLQEVKVDSKIAIQTDLEIKSDTKEAKVTLKTTQTLDLDVDIDIEVPVKISKNRVALKATSDKEIEQIDTKANESVRTDVKVRELPQSIKSMPLFKAQNTKEITTEQLVQTRLSTLNIADIKPIKSKADETLKMLLRGENISKSDTGFTADFSVATARVIAPSATTEVSKNLESLLRGETSETATKLDGLSVNKADSFEVKLNEAKQMTKYLSQDVKTAIEDYKSPFTRIKVQLNPQRLGEVDLTIVQRGKNLHINLSSNNAAINALALNANDLKAQLTNTGINNATLNFSNNSQNPESGFNQQQQHSQREKEADREYNFFNEEETNEEILNSLEIVVPHYA